MKLATFDDGTRDGELLLVSRDGRRARPAGTPRTLQAALDDWPRYAPALRGAWQALQDDPSAGDPVDPDRLLAPLPRAYEWVDGSAYINHIVLVRKARGAEPPPTLRTVPLVYQGGSGVLLPPRADLPLVDPAWGLDFESEVCAVLGDVPAGVSPEQAGAHVRLLMLCNDVTLRNLIPDELARGFGFFQSKPATAFSPFAVTPDELGNAWVDGRVHLPLETRLNGRVVGHVHAGPEMHFSFFDLMAHVARTRSFVAGTILGSGTVSNADPRAGISCLAERRMREILDDGAARTGFLQLGDVVEIDMHDHAGVNVFGTIRNRVTSP